MIFVMTHFLIVLCSLFLFPAHSAESSVSAPFMPEALLAKTASSESKKKKNSSNSSDKKNSNPQKTAQGETDTTTEDYSPSLTESLNDSNDLKKQIKRQLSADHSQTIPEENPSEEEVANFGNISVSISERKKEEKLRTVNKNK